MTETRSPRLEIEEPDTLSSRLSIAQLAGLLSSLLLGIAAAFWFISVVFVTIPSDIQRLGFLLQSLNRSGADPQIVVFGDSVLMSGVDAAILADELPDQPLSWNCASTGQSMTEAFLLTQELPGSVNTVVYGVAFRAKAKEKSLPVHPQKYNTLFMYGFRPEERTRAVLDQIFGDDVSDLFAESWFEQVFSARWAIRQFIDTQVRRLLRPDLALERATLDLYHPQSYEKVIDSKITERFLKRESQIFAKEGIALAEGTISLAQAVASEAETNSKKVLYLLPPIHPSLLNAFQPDIQAVAAEVAALTDRYPNVFFMDASTLLQREHFIDDKHPTNDGAAILSRRVAAFLSAN